MIMQTPGFVRQPNRGSFHWPAKMLSKKSPMIIVIIICFCTVEFKKFKNFDYLLMAMYLDLDSVFGLLFRSLFAQECCLENFYRGF